MTINKINSPAEIYAPLDVTQGSSEAARAEQESPLSRLTDTASFSTVAPKIQAMLEEIASPASNVVDTLRDNVSRLQDGFVEALYDTLEGQPGISLDTKLTLLLNEGGVLAVAGDHPQQEAINNLLAGTPELSDAFAEIAAQSSALKDIQSLHSTVSGASGLDNYARQSVAGQPGDAVYQISLKGEMNHFYFGRR